MAATLITTDSTELTDQRLGFIAVSLSNWTATTEPQYTAGSCFEDAGSLYYCSALEDCGTDAQWAAIGNNTLVYSYFDPSALTFYWSSTAPAWDAAKQGWYHGVSTTHRCLVSVYKDGSGNYVRKNILKDRRSLYSKNYAYETDECAYTTVAKNTLVLSLNSTNNASLTTVYTSKSFYVKKPVCAYINTSRVSGSTYGFATDSNSVASVWFSFRLLSLADGGQYKMNDSRIGIRHCLFLNPGKYKIITKHYEQYGIGAGERKLSLYVNGTYGASSISSRAIIDT